MHLTYQPEFTTNHLNRIESIGFVFINLSKAYFSDNASKPHKTSRGFSTDAKIPCNLRLVFVISHFNLYKLNVLQKDFNS